MRRKRIITILFCLISSLGFLFTVASCKTSNKKDEYTITFDSRGGSEVAPQIVQKGNKITRPEDPTKDKFFFENWYKEIDYTNVWKFDEDIPDKDTILYAKWDTSYIMTFDTQGAGIIIDQSVREGGKPERPADPKKEHYTFGGWFKEPNCINAWDFDKDVVTKTTIVYAKWTINKYSITFEPNGGSSVSKQLVEANQKAVRPASPTRIGYLFVGWYMDAELTKQFDFVNTAISKDITLYAKWKETTEDPNKLIVIFNSKLGSEVPSLENVVPGSKIAKPADPVREGYTFIGWFKDTDGELVEEFNFDEDRITENITLYAKWEVVKFTVTFDSNGGSSVASQEVEANGKAMRPTSPVKEGFIFIAWYKEADFENVFDFVNTRITEDITLYARWKETSTDPTKLEVTFITKGGSEVPSIENIVPGSKITRPTDPVREGYTFVGWFKDTDGELVEEFNFDEETITKNIVLYAKWEIKKYTITFNSNGGSSEASQIVEAGSLAIRPTSPVREGYIFLGWYKEAELKNEFDFVNTRITSDWTLYAKWESASVSEDKFNVYFNSKGGTEVATLEGIPLGSKITRPADPVRDGFTFLGWFKDEHGGLEDKFNFDVDIITEDITLYAKWTITSYLVTFDVDGGSQIPSQNVNIHDKVVRPSNPVKANHTFVGWFKDKACTIEWKFEEETIISNTTIYAKWDKNPVTEDLEIKFPFAQFNSQVSKDAEEKTIEDFEISQFKVSTGVKPTAAMLNSQGKDIFFTVNGKFSNSLKIVGTGGSTKADTIVTLYKDTNTLVKVLGKAAMNGGSFAATIDGLEAGTYRIKTENSLKITVFTLYEYNQAVEVTVKFETFHGTSMQDAIITKWSTLSKPEDPVKDGYIFKGWFLDETCQSAFDFASKIDADITLYAKWEEKPLDPTIPIYAVTYESNGGSLIPTKNVNEGGKVAAPANPTREGYIFLGWYDDPWFEQEHDFGLPIMDNITLYARWEEKPVTIIFENTNIDKLEIKKGTRVPEPLENPTKPNFIFAGWYKDNTYQEKFDFNTLIYVDTQIYAKWEKDPNASDYIEAGPGQILEKGAVELIRAVGQVEGAYITFRPYAGATDYTITLRNSNNTSSKILDENYVYIRSMSDGSLRADILGIPAGSYEAIIYPKGDETAKGSSCMFTVGEYDRSGYAHFNYTEGVGAYDDSGALKENAIVLWVTDENKNTISITHKGTTVVGIGNILNSVGEDVGGGVTAKGGKANSNQGIMKKLAEDNIPLVVRFVGTVSNTGLYKKATFTAKNAPKIDGLTIFNSLDWGGSLGDNGHMARIKSGKDVTLEGVGEDAVIDGWGFHYMAESSAPELGKSFEVRNLTFINTPEDAVGMEGVQASANVNSILTASVERCWIHNNEFYGPDISGPAESDKGEGDGSCDFKRGQYFTCSYNYFEGCHKTNLVGSADTSLQYNMTYHHNYWKLCKARGPLARNANIHMYNNLFEEQTDYAMNTRANSYIFSEYNMFYKCKNAQAVESGAIKSYNDSFATTLQNKGSGGTIVKNKTDIVPNNCKFGGENIDYSKFDTNPQQSYIPSGEYVLQTSVTEARKAIYAFAGVRRAQNVSMSDVDLSYVSILPSGVTPVKVDTYPTTLTPGKISKTVYAFTLNRSASVKISYGTAEGVLVNLAGECMLTGSGSVTLKAGTYIAQAQNFQPGDSKTLALGTFKDMNIDSIEILEHDDGAELIADYDAKANKIPSTIQYTNACYQTIKAAKEAYALIPSEYKPKVTVPYTKVTSAWTEYVSLGKAKVEELINKIGTVTENSGYDITSARTAYTQLVKEEPSVQISNYQILVNAENAFKEYAVTSCINRINEIKTPITLDSRESIEAARAEYDALGSTEKNKITNIQKLLDAEKELNELLIVENVIDLISMVDMNSIASMQEVLTAYAELTATQKDKVTNADRITIIRVSLTMKLIDSIGTVTPSSKSSIEAAEAMYNSLDATEKDQVTNYTTLVEAKNRFEELMNTRIECTFNGEPSNPAISVTGKYGATAATIDGVSYTTGLKMESSTSVSFQNDIARTLTLHVTAGKVVEVDGTAYTADSNGVITVQLSAGSHTISKGKKGTTGTLLYALFLQ